MARTCALFYNKYINLYLCDLGQTRPRNNTVLEYSGTGGATGDSPHSGRTSFFSKISSRFSKR